jgi:hypothetical protein
VAQGALPAYRLVKAAQEAGLGTVSPN